MRQFLGRRWPLATVAAAALAIALVPAPATATATATASKLGLEPVATFDFAAGESPEGIAIDRHGVIYTGFAFTGEIVALHPDGSQHSVAQVDPAGGLLLGLTIDRSGDLLAAVRGGTPQSNGVWRVTLAGEAELWAPLDPAGQPNGIFADRRGNTYVGDSLLGVVWRIDPAGEVQLWSDDPLLAGDPDAGLPVAFGANGVLLHQGALYVANTDRGSVVRIPVRPDGSAGPAQLYVAHPALLGADDLAFDVLGNLYVTTDGIGNSLVKVTRWGSVHTIATAEDGLDFPAQLVFGQRPRESRTLFIANVGASFGTPSVLAARLPFPGWPAGNP